MSLDWLTPKVQNRLEALQLSVRWVRSGNRLGGRYVINRRGSSIEFADYNPYSPGDDIRSIDWNLYARLDRLFVKTYREEIALSVELVLDATPSMGLPRPEKFERAKRIATSLGYVALTSGHHVRVSVFRPGPILQGPWYHNRKDLRRMAERLDSVEVSKPVSFSDWTNRAALALRLHGGQAIIVTDGMIRPAEFYRALHRLMVCNVELRIIQVISKEELYPSRLFRGGSLVDAETGQTHQLGYSAEELEGAMSRHNEDLARFCKRHGIPFAQHRLNESVDSFIMNVLPVNGFLE